MFRPFQQAASAGRKTRRGALVALITAAAAITGGGSAPSPVAAQALPTATVTVTQTVAQLLEIPGGVKPQKLKMIEEEGYLCVMAFHPVPPGISWVCVPPIQ